MTKAHVHISRRSEGDEWSLEGRRIDSPENRGAVQAIFDAYLDQALIIVKHEYLNSATGPTFDACRTMAEYDAFLETIDEGDIVAVWSAWDVCKKDKILVWGKKPDEEGYVPLNGAY